MAYRFEQGESVPIPFEKIEPEYRKLFGIEVSKPPTEKTEPVSPTHEEKILTTTEEKVDLVGVGEER